MLGGVHYLTNGGKNITLMWWTDSYTILIQTMQDFVTPDKGLDIYLDIYLPPLPYEFMYTHV